jgi:hypothetical protein
VHAIFHSIITVSTQHFQSSHLSLTREFPSDHSLGEVEWPQAGAPPYGLKRRHKGRAGSSCSPKILRYGTTATFPLQPLVLTASSLRDGDTHAKQKNAPC